jgi:hypothetical protein
LGEAAIAYLILEGWIVNESSQPIQLGFLRLVGRDVIVGMIIKVHLKYHWIVAIAFDAHFGFLPSYLC